MASKKEIEVARSKFFGHKATTVVKKVVEAC
jgi:hypothetical protein